MKATLHDELMHEAGFETDYHRELERRREQRRRTRGLVAVVVGALVIIAASAVELLADYLPGIPRLVVGVAILIGAVVGVLPVVDWVRPGRAVDGGPDLMNVRDHPLYMISVAAGVARAFTVVLERLDHREKGCDEELQEARRRNVRERRFS